MALVIKIGTAVYVRISISGLEGNDIAEYSDFPGGSWDLVTRVISKVAVHQHIISTYNPNHGTYNRT